MIEIRKSLGNDPFLSAHRESSLKKGKSRFNMRTNGYRVLKELQNDPARTALAMAASATVIILDMPRTISERRQQIFGS